jgi:hypothetical protein
MADLPGDLNCLQSCTGLVSRGLLEIRTAIYVPIQEEAIIGADFKESDDESPVDQDFVM